MEQVIYSPSDQRVMVLPQEEQETKTNSGIIIPKGTDESKPGIGVVVAVGFGTEDHPMNFTVGQTVIYSQYSGLDIKLNLVGHGHRIYKVMNQLDIMGTIKIHK